MSEDDRPSLPFHLGDGCVSAVPIRDLLHRTTISTVLPVQLSDYPRKVSARILLFIRTGAVSLKGLTLREFGYLVYLANAMGVAGIIEEVQKKYDNYQASRLQPEVMQFINIASVAPSINPRKMLENVSRGYGSSAALSNAVESLWPSGMALFCRFYLFDPPDHHHEKAVLRAVLHWMSHSQPKESSLLEVLNSLPKMTKVRESFPFPPPTFHRDVDGEVEQMYFTSILGSKYETVWNNWLESKAREDEDVTMWLPRVGEREEEELVDIRARSLPDSLYQNGGNSNGLDPLAQSAALRPPPALPQPDFSRTAFPVGNSPPLRENLVVARQDPPRLNKMDLLKKMLKVPLVKLKNRFRRNNP